MLIRIFFWLLVTAYAAVGQIQVKGRVVDAATQKPIAHAHIQPLYIPLEAVTNSVGVFDLPGLPAGELELKVTSPGYAFVTLKVNLKNPVNVITVKLEEEQLPALTSFQAELNLYREKIFVTTDKPYYYPGEIIWMKGFVNYIDLSKRDSLSRVVYVELVDKKSKIKIRHILSLDSGRLAGSMIIPNKLPDGNYVLRAYSRFMYNFGADQFFYKSIPILKTSERVLPIAINEDAPTATNEIVTSKNGYGLRERAEVLLPKLPKGNYAVSVTDLNQVVPIPQQNITQCWNFEPGLAKVPPVAIDQIVEKGVRFTGQFVSEYRTGKQVVLSLFKQDLTEALEFTTDEKGWFQVNGLKFYDSISYFYKAKRGKKGNEFFGRVQLAQENEPVPQLVVPGYWFITESAQGSQRMLATYLAPPEVKMLEEVEVRASRIENSPYKGIRGGADKVVKAESLLNFGNLLLSLQGKIPGLTINCAVAPCEVRFSRAAGGSISASTEPLVLINDTPVGGSAGVTLQNIDINMVERIEFSGRVNVLYGDQGRNGIIAVYLKEGFTRFSRPEDITPSFELMGFTRPMNFVNPDYNNPLQEKSITDYRSTLYWNPELAYSPVTGYGFSFFTSDMPGKFRIVVQGVTHQNEPVYLERTIQVSD
ncbi:MAG: carboxypeptidase regulatory-like domain-containing protein [Cytophagales bacterium]|nr:carboxypeptidase regulatory-like domain-containing protein [Cytophagales bacterium]